MPHYPFGEDVTIHRRTATGHDEYGVVTYTYADILISGGVITPNAPEETDTAGKADSATDRWNWYPPRGTVVQLDDTCTVRGAVCDVEGRTQDYGRHAITGAPGPLVVRLARRT